MESKTSGRFHHYEPPQKPPAQAEDGSKGGGSGQDVNECEVPLPNVRLEEVGRSEYFSAKKTVPPVGTPVQVRRNLVGGRIAVEAARGNQSIGFLPTQYNYLLGCLKDGYKYKGKITASADSPTPRVVVDLFPA
jgi:hypothetical protein